MSKLRIQGTLVNYDQSYYSEVEIDCNSGLITKVSATSSGKADLKFERALIFPGFVDLHVHAREDASGRMNYKEDYVTCSRAAINGGVVHFADMPNTPAAPVTDEIYEEKKGIAKKSLVDVTLYAGIGPKTSPLTFDVPYKVFTGPSVGNLYFTSKDQLDQVIKKYQGKHVSFHCESPEVMEKYAKEPTHEKRRPPEAEIEGIKFALELIENYELQGKICHLSTAGGLELIKKAKQKGIKVMTEVAPHHLYFDNSMGLQMNPPLRRAEDRLALLEGLKKGHIDFLASDHAPHTREEKAQGISGVPELDTYGPFACWLMAEHGFTPEDIARVCAYNPGKFVNEFSAGKFGRIAEGYVGSLTIINPSEPWTLSRQDLKTKCGWSPYEGVTFPGRVSHTITRGKVYEHK